MKPDIHPEYKMIRVHCACGNEFVTRSTANEIRVEICSNCHPFFTGKQKIVDTAGKVDRFRRRYEKKELSARPLLPSPSGPSWLTCPDRKTHVRAHR